MASKDAEKLQREGKKRQGMASAVPIQPIKMKGA
jgi:hypothetical protein